MKPDMTVVRQNPCRVTLHGFTPRRLLPSRPNTHVSASEGNILFTTTCPWGMNVILLWARRKAFSRHRFQGPKNKNMTKFWKDTDPWKFLKQFPSVVDISRYCPGSNHHHVTGRGHMGMCQESTSTHHFEIPSSLPTSHKICFQSQIYFSKVTGLFFFSRCSKITRICNFAATQKL